MKIRNLIGFIVVFSIAIYLVTAGIAGSESQVSPEDITNEKNIPSLSLQQSFANSEQLDQDRSIVSKTAVISLVVAVIGIVAFRRNSNS